MSTAIRSGARLLFRVDPLPGESPRGYLCRVAQAHSYCGPLSLAQIAGLPPAGLERDDSAKQVAHVLRLEPEEWRMMCYRQIGGQTRFKQRLFHGERISADDLNYLRPRICPCCLMESPIWWAVWDLALVTACPIHRCHLLKQCPACKRTLAWQRPVVHECRCGLDLRTLAPEAATRDLVAINAVIYRAAGHSPGTAAELDLADCGFPPEMLHLRLGSLLRLIVFVGSIRWSDRLRLKQQPFAATDLLAATEIDRAAVAVLREWPRSLREVLRHMLPPETAHPTDLTFSEIFGNFYRHLFCLLPRGEFGFLHDVFERFVIEDWTGLIRCQHRYFSATVRLNSQWVTANEAEQIAHIHGGKIVELVRQGQIESIFFSVRRGGSRTECWIRRESLNRWIAARDAEFARYMPRPEAMRVLGLAHTTIVRIAAAGVMRYVEGPDQHLPFGCFFLREDVMRIKLAFEKHSAPLKEYTASGEFIALRHAISDFLGGDSGLASVIRAVIDGSLAPAGYTNRFRGITGYLFLAKDLRKYRPVPGMTAPPEGVMNFREAAAVLSVSVPVIRGLVVQGIMHTTSEYRNGLSRLLPTADVRHFAERFLALSVLARRFQLNTGSLARHLKEAGTPLLEIPMPEEGKGHAYFVSKDVAAQIQFPSHRMLREQAQCRIDASRKRRWTEYRLAKEAALGRPIRRVRANLRHSDNGEK